MRILNRYILREIAVPSMMALTVFAFLAVANELRERMDVIESAQIQPADLARMAILFLPSLLYYIVPLMYIMGIMLAFGRLSQNSETVAMKAAGIPLKRVVAPVLIGGALLSVASFLLQDRIQPMAIRKVNNFIYTELPKRATMDLLSTGVMHELGNWRVYIGGKDVKTDTLLDVDLLEIKETGETWVYHADRARFFTEGGRARLFIETGYLIIPEQMARMKISDFTFTAPHPDAQVIPRDIRVFSFTELLREDAMLVESILEHGEIEDISEVYGKISQLPRGVSIHSLMRLYGLRNEMRERLALPLACLTVSLLAAPLAVRGGREGRSWSFAIGFGVCLMFYLLFMVTQARSLCSINEIVLRGLTPNLVVGGLGMYTLWRVDHI